MRRIYQVTSLVFILLAALMIVGAQGLRYTSPNGPGPGFFPFWLALFLGGLSLIWLVQVTLQPVAPMKEGFLPDRGGVVRILAIVIAVLLFGLLLEFIGFQVMMFALLSFLLVALGRRNPVVSVIVCFAGSIGLYYVFKHYLGVNLPASSIELLQNLGL